MTLASIEGHRKLKKDLYSGGVVNIDVNAHRAHKEARERALRQMQEQKALSTNVVTMQDQINSIQSEMSQIKSLLQQLLDK